MQHAAIGRRKRECSGKGNGRTRRALLLVRPVGAGRQERAETGDADREVDAVRGGRQAGGATCAFIANARSKLPNDDPASADRPSYRTYTVGLELGCCRTPCAQRMFLGRTLPPSGTSQ
jgi:hypothetical protein